MIASEDARIGTPYSRVWGAYLSGMWIYRLGLARAKELDGLMRNIPATKRFIERAAGEGVRTVVAERDGPFGDYSAAPDAEKPDPRNVIEP